MCVCMCVCVCVCVCVYPPLRAIKRIGRGGSKEAGNKPFFAGGKLGLHIIISFCIVSSALHITSSYRPTYLQSKV